MIINRNKIISKNEKYCYNIFSQGLGLMFSKRKNLVMVFKKLRKIRLHNFFVFYPIDVLVLDENKMIIEIKRDFKPFTFWNSMKEGMYVVELGFKNDVELSDYQEGELLKFR
tara:strand:- start:2777 stop:3112 length:336 start_codon:yes stop_codon:yes gene_type:complete